MEQTFLLQIEVSEVEEVSYIVAFRSAKLTMCGKIIQAPAPFATRWSMGWTCSTGGSSKPTFRDVYMVR